MTLVLLSLLLGCGMDGSDDVPAGDRADVRPDKERGEGRGGKKKNKKNKREKGGDEGKGGGGLIPTTPFPKVDDPCAALPSGRFIYSFAYEGETHEIPMFIGKGSGSRDLAFLLHGGGGGPPSIMKKTLMHKKALDEDFVAVVPQGTELGGEIRWNTGKFRDDLKERLKPGQVPRNDVAYLDALAKALEKDVCANHVTPVGFSSGGQMAHRWACEGDNVDAIVTGAGELLIEHETCNRPTPVLSYVGTEDKVYRESPNPRYPEMPSAPETIELWKKHNKCQGKSEDRKIDDRTTCTIHKGCAAPTQLCVIEGMPHMFPAPWGDKGVDFNGAEYGWDWVQNTKKRK